MTAVAFSVYAVYVYSNLSSIDLAGSPANIPEILGMPALETNRGTLYGHTGGVYGVGDVSAFRYTIRVSVRQPMDRCWYLLFLSDCCSGKALTVYRNTCMPSLYFSLCFAFLRQHHALRLFHWQQA